MFEFLVYVESKGYVAVDFYDGSIMYDFENDTTRICDIDLFRKTPTFNDMGEEYWGTKRLKAPEEYAYGEVVDGVTNVFTLGALIFHIFGSYSEDDIGQMDGYSEILVKPAKDVSTSDLTNELTAALVDSGYQVSKIVNEAEITADARQKSMPFFLISFFSLTISIFIIYSSYKVITLDRLPVIGTFRSIGATQKAVTRILLLESLLYGCMGGLIGIPVGMFFLKLILQGMGQSLSQGIEIPVVISTFSIIISFTVAIAVSLLSAWLPVRRASHLPIKDVVLGTVEEKRIPRRFIVGIGIVLFLVSVFLPKIVSGNMLYLAGGFSLLGLIVATILVIPLMTNLISMGLERLYGLIFNNEGRLAARNMRDNKNIEQNITLLFISISAVIAISVVGNFVTTYISDVFNGAELQGFADGQMESDFVEKVENMEGIEEVCL